MALALGAVVGRLVDMERKQARDAVSGRPRPSGCGTSSADGSTCSRPEPGGACARLVARPRPGLRAFVRELRSLLPFDRAAILLAEGGGARVMATAGLGAEDDLEPGTAITVPGVILDGVIEEGQTIYREDIAEERHRRKRGCSRSACGPASWPAAARDPLDRRPRDLAYPPASFREEELGLVTLLGRLVATAVQTCAPTKPSGRRWRSCGGCRRSAPTSSRSSRTSCAARWRP